jgi:hypothetical protein
MATVLASLAFLAVPTWMIWTAQAADEDPKGPVPSSYDQIAPVLQGKGTFKAVMEKDKADKVGVMARQKKLLEERYDLTPRPDKTIKMTRGKPIPVGPTAKLPQGMTWDKLAETPIDKIREQGLFPKGFCRSFRRRCF